MSSQNNKTLVKRMGGLMGAIAATAVMVLPIATPANAKPSLLADNHGGTTEAPKPAAEATSTSETPAPTTEAGPHLEMPGMPAESAAPAFETPETATPAADSTPDQTTGQTPDQTIVEIAAANETFKTLVAALTEAELAEVLQGEGPFTVFAPTDEAFAALPEGTVEELLQPENREELIKLLTYHVVPGSLQANDLTSGEVATVEGTPVTITVSEGTVTVNEATVIQPDIIASNGVIHAVDQVILPPDM
jgi:uncharacterized surface protein with fasciclin (FAS1) repeats